MFGLHAGALPLHPKVQAILNHFKLPESVRIDLSENRTTISIFEAHRLSIVNEYTRVGCAIGRSIELAKSMTKFSQTALKLDRARLWKCALKEFDCESLQLNQIDHDQLLKEMKFGAERFLINRIGRHGSSSLHSLDEMYAAVMPKVLDENKLK